LEQGLAAIKNGVLAGKMKPKTFDGMDCLVASPCFTVTRWDGVHLGISGNPPEPSGRSVGIFVGLNGHGLIDAKGFGKMEVRMGKAAVVPASIDDFFIKAESFDFEALSAHLPPRTAEVSSTERKTMRVSS
jgi:mannose-6-phosphate isomerase class I